MPDHGIPWTDYQDDYDTIREAIARVIPGFENINARIRSRGSFLLPWTTATGGSAMAAKSCSPTRTTSPASV